MTPEQMRALASDNAASTVKWMTRRQLRDLSIRNSAALRTAADQLEAVQAWVDERYHHFQEISELDAILTGGTAPQEDRNE